MVRAETLKLLDKVHRPFGILLVVFGQPSGEAEHPSDAGAFAEGEARAHGAERHVADGKLDEDEVDEEELGRVGLGIEEGGEFFVGGVVDDGVVVYNSSES